MLSGAIAFLLGGILFFTLGILICINTGEKEPLFFSAFAVPFLIVGGNFIIKDIKEKRHLKDIVKNGYCITARIIGFEDDYSITINDRPGFYYVAKYTSIDGDEVFFRSKTLVKRPKDMDSMLNRKVIIYLEDKQDMTNYVFDLKSLREDF